MIRWSEWSADAANEACQTLKGTGWIAKEVASWSVYAAYWAPEPNANDEKIERQWQIEKLIEYLKNV